MDPQNYRISYGAKLYLRIGAIVIGGLNPVAILEEQGIEVASRALSGLVDYRRLFPYEELAERLGGRL